jgi:hypothetical protein
MDEIVLACMDKDPARRPASMLELRELLRPIAEQLGPEGMMRDVPERAEMTPTPATAQGLQQLARSAGAAPAPKDKAQPARRKSSWGAIAGVVISLCVVGAGVAVLRPWARGSTKATTGFGEWRVLPKAPAAATSNVQAAPPPDRGVVSVQTDPPGAEVFADHVHQGVAPLDLTVQFPVEIKLTLEGYKTIRRKITRAGAIRIRLIAEPGSNLPRPPEQEEGNKPSPDPEAQEAVP